MHRTIAAILVFTAASIPGLAQIQITPSGSVDPSGTLIGVVIKDEAGHPVEGANVTFTFPTFGPSARFSNDDRSTTSVTNAYGRAVARAIRREVGSGRYSLKVTAWHGNHNASIYLPQENIAPEPKRSWMSGRRFGIIAGAAGGAILGTVLINGFGSPSTSAPAGSISPGGAVVGGPR